MYVVFFSDKKFYMFTRFCFVFISKCNTTWLDFLLLQMNQTFNIFKANYKNTFFMFLNIRISQCAVNLIFLKRFELVSPFSNGNSVLYSFTLFDV